MSMPTSYTKAAETLVERIRALVPTHPEILTFDDPWALFRVPGFKCSDLDVSLAMASAALAQVQRENRGRP